MNLPNQAKTALTLSGLSPSIISLCITEFYTHGDFLPFFEEKPYSRAERTVASKGNLLIVVPNASFGEQLANDLDFLTQTEEVKVCTFFPWEVLPFDGLSPTSVVSAERLATISRLASNRQTIVIASADALMQYLPSIEQIINLKLTFSIGKEYQREKILKKLDSFGYLRSRIVEEVGQIAVRGSVIDIFPPGTSKPYRLEFFDEQLESIRSFKAQDQRSLEKLESIEIIPVREFFCDEKIDTEIIRKRAEELELPLSAVRDLEEALTENLPYPGIEHLQSLFLKESASLLDYFSENDAVMLCDDLGVESQLEDFSEIVKERAKRADEEGRLYPRPEVAYASAAKVFVEVSSRALVKFNEIPLLQLGDFANPEKPQSIACYSLNALRSKLQVAKKSELPFLPLIEEIKQKLISGYKVVIVTSQPTRKKRIRELLETYDLGAEIVAEFATAPRAGTEPRPYSLADESESATSSRAGTEPRPYSLAGESSEFAELEGACRGGVPSPPANFQTNTLFEVAERVKANLLIIDGSLSSGFRLPSRFLEVISERDIFSDTRKLQRAKATSSVRRFLGSVSQLQQDDYVVHLDHGVAIYRGLKEIKIEGKLGDFLVLEYANKDKLFIPVDNIGKVQKYVAKEGLAPKLSQLGTKNWEKSKEKVKKEVVELAGQLITLYAKREIARGYSFGELGADDYAFADSFAFDETPDQEAAINDVLADMQRDQPMDRLVCGDVGYGKTEVAMRAAFKSISGGKQVAVLVPTTILADQHYVNFKERFESFGATVACVSRFFTASENKETLQNVLAGKIDIIIGTHRLLQKDVDFKDLGLIVIDEEHRFGVAHKEKLKRFRESVDVLTLTATPIPRTLHMSLSGIRDLSVIETPPCDRQLIRTYIAQYEANIVREAVMRELGRQGQVFYIYNRVKNIELVRNELAELVPEARVAFAHGQMKDKELEEIMHKFVSHEIDVLVSTTIVESGLDISNANTIIIRNANNFGLAELYQLRGRVGRGSRRAYAYLLIPDPKTLGDDAKKRLQVLQSLDDLGVGFRLALQDMEIRGAGNLLGKDQSGQIAAVGYELYSRILKETINAMQEGKVLDLSVSANLPAVDPEVNIGFPAHIPPSYIPDLAERLLLYQRLVCIVDELEGEQLQEEIEDRFGSMPEEMQDLLALMVFRSLLKRSAIISAKLKSDVLTINFHHEMKIDSQLVMKCVSSSSGEIRVNPSMALSIMLANKPQTPWDLHRKLKHVLDELGVHL